MNTWQSLQKCCWENGISACRKMKLYPYFSPCTSINSKCIEDLNRTPETLKLVQEKAGRYTGSKKYMQWLRNSSGSATKRKDLWLCLREIKKLLHHITNCV
jgi:hypothetical protein